MQINKTHSDSGLFLPLEPASVNTTLRQARRLIARDGAGRIYADLPIAPGKPARFKVRGEAGVHQLSVVAADGRVLEEQRLRLAPRTLIHCDQGPYAQLMMNVQKMMESCFESRPRVINGRSYRFLIGWSRDHVYTLKAAKYFVDDVKSGLDFFLETQLPNGMFWDNIETNREAPAPTWFGEALGEGWFTYTNGGKTLLRRVPVLADTEYVFAEGVWLAWKATGDSGWAKAQLPRLEKALKYMTSDPLRWSRKHGLMRRSFTMDEWDFANKHYCAGDHRCIHPEDPTFLFHGNQSGLYATYWRMADMYESVGNARRATQLRRQGEALRKRANDKLFFSTQYGHMIPETMDPKEVYALVGDERKRMSLSTGYTINRHLPTHAMAVKILKEYQRRARQHKSDSFAEWWSMDPTYTPSQWPGQQTGTAGCPQGEYMNGGIVPLVGGELAKAAFDHGMEAYGIDILQRMWDLAQRDGDWLHQAYRRQPANVKLPKAHFQFIDLRSLANRGLKEKTHPPVEAWMGEGPNDMRNLPTGRQTFGAIEFKIIDPKSNAGRSVLRMDGAGIKAPAQTTIPINNLKAASLYFLHTVGKSSRAQILATYDVTYEDGTTARIWIRSGREIGHWWGTSEHSVDHAIARRAWWGANGQWKNVGLYMLGWNNPNPDKAITSIRIEMLKEAGSLMIAGISASDKPVAFEPTIRSYGLPDCWTQASVYYAVAEGLAGIEDTGTAYSAVRIAPRWASSEATEAQVTLHYPASRYYCSYAYKLNRKGRRIDLDVTGSLDTAQLHCLLPFGKARKVSVDGVEVPFENKTIERSRYVDFTLKELPRGAVRIEY